MSLFQFSFLLRYDSAIVFVMLFLINLLLEMIPLRYRKRVLLLSLSLPPINPHLLRVSNYKQDKGAKGIIRSQIEIMMLWHVYE